MFARTSAHSTLSWAAWIRPLSAAALIGTTLICGPLGCATNACTGVTKAALTSTDAGLRHDAFVGLGTCPSPMSATELGQLFEATPDLGDRQHIVQALGKLGSTDAHTQLQRIADSATGTLAIQARGYLRTSMANGGGASNGGAN